MMVPFVCLFALLAVTRIEAAAVTNFELYKILIDSPDAKEYTADDVTHDDVITADADNFIDLPGDADDEVDIGVLTEKLGLLNKIGVDTAKTDDSLGGGCLCRLDYCTCCIKHIFYVKVVNRTISVTLTACVTVQYLPSATSFLLDFVLNGHRVYHRVVSLVHPPLICATLTGRIVTGKACVEFYNVVVSQKSLCIRLSGFLDITGKRVYFRLPFGCFRIPVMNGGLLARMVGQGELSSASDSDTIMTASWDKN